jgi:hypothetical protein
VYGDLELDLDGRRRFHHVQVTSPVPSRQIGSAAGNMRTANGAASVT